MYKFTIPSAAFALALAATPAVQQGPALQFKEQSLTIKDSPSEDDAALVVDAESEQPLESFELRDPNGHVVLRLRAATGERVAVSGLSIEGRESTLYALTSTHAEGVYQLSGRTVTGRPVLGSAALSHQLLAPPVVNFPTPDATGVPTSGLVISWNNDPGAARYYIELEQGDNDGLTAMLGPGTHSFSVPSGLLAGATESTLEVQAIAANGNRTLTQLTFTTN